MNFKKIGEVNRIVDMCELLFALIDNCESSEHFTEKEKISLMRQYSKEISRLNLLLKEVCKLEKIYNEQKSI